MAIRFQLRRGNTAQNSVFTGSEGELTMDTETGQLKVHDGTTQGGMATVDPLVAFQIPTAENNYTWYRKYASGWVEMGGVDSFNSTANRTQTIQLPIELNSSEYTILLMGFGSKGALGIRASAQTTNSFTYVQSSAEANYLGTKIFWEVKGMAA